MRAACGACSGAPQPASHPCIHSSPSPEAAWTVVGVGLGTWFRLGLNWRTESRPYGGQRPRVLSKGMPVNWKVMPVTPPADTAGEDPHPVPAPCSDSGRHRHQAVTAFGRKDAGGGRGVLSSRLSGKPLLFFLSLPGSWPQLALTSTCEHCVLCAC